MKNKIFFIFLLIHSTFSTFAQRVIWDSSYDYKLTFLKDEKNINTEYTFNEAKIDGNTEAEYLAETKKAMNEDKAGKGDKYVGLWEEHKKKKFNVHFEKTFNKMMKKKLKASNKAVSNYKLIIKLKNVKAGTSTYMKNQPAYADYEICFVENNTNKIMAKASIMNTKGLVKAKTNIGSQGYVQRVIARAMNADITNRLAQCYDAAATSTAKYILRFPKKKK